MALILNMGTVADLDVAMENINEADRYIERQSIIYGVEPVTEGIGSKVVAGIKKFVQWCVKMVIKLWKAIIKFVKWVINKIKKLFKMLVGKIKGDKVSEVTDANIENKLIMVSNDSAKLVTDTVNKSSDIKKLSTLAINNISKVIKERSKEEVEYVKKYESLDLGTTKESYELDDALLEKVVNNARVGQYKDKTTYLDYDWAKQDINNQLNDWREDRAARGKENDEYSDRLFIGAAKRELGDFYASTNSVTGGSLLGHFYNHDVSIFNIERAKKVVESKNFIDDYITLVDEFVFKTAMEGSTAPRLVIGNMVAMINYVKDSYVGSLASEDGKISVDTIVHKFFAKDFMIYEDNPEITRTWLKLRINYSRSIVLTLKKILTFNADMLGLTKDEIDSMNGEMNESESAKTVMALAQKAFYEDWIEEYRRIDLRYFGMGAITISPKIVADWDSPERCREIIMLLIKYDLIVNAHGGVVWLEDEEKDAWIIEKVKCPYENAGEVWWESPDEVVEWVKNNYKKFKIKRVLFMNCNPGHVKLSDEWAYKNKHVMFQMSTQTMLA